MNKTQTLLKLLVLMLILTSCGDKAITIGNFSSSDSQITYPFTHGAVTETGDSIYVHYVYIGSGSVKYTYNEETQDVDASVYGDGASIMLTLFSSGSELPVGTFTPANYDYAEEVDYNQLVSNKQYESSLSFFHDGNMSYDVDGETKSRTGATEIYSNWSDSQWMLSCFQAPLTIAKDGDDYVFTYNGKVKGFIGSEHESRIGSTVDETSFDATLNCTYVEDEDPLFN